MKIATLIISILLISALFLTACQQAPVDDGEATQTTPTGDSTEEAVEGAEDIDIIAEDEIEIGELI